MFQRLKDLVASGTDQAINRVHAKLKPEIKGINGLAGGFALLVMADRVVEEAEMEAVSEYLIDMDIIIERRLTREVAELFLAHVDFLEKAHKRGVVELNISIGELLEDISEAQDDREWSKIIAKTTTLVTSGEKADAGEIKTRERILKALGK